MIGKEKFHLLNKNYEVYYLDGTLEISTTKIKKDLNNQRG